MIYLYKLFCRGFVNVNMLSSAVVSEVDLVEMVVWRIFLCFFMIKF